MSMNNLGKHVPNSRRDVAYQWLQSIGVERVEAFSAVETIAGHLERDHPHEGLEAGRKVVDVTGAYRLFAILLTDPEGAPPRTPRHTSAKGAFGD